MENQTNAHIGAPKANSLAQAIVETVAYADIFDSPLTANQIYRYLAGLKCSSEEFQDVLRNDNLLSVQLEQHENYFVLRNRKEIIERHKQRQSKSARLWPQAIRFGRIIAQIPFVKMIAVTGSLAVDNETENDIDYLIVTSPGRVWLCRAMIVLLVRIAARIGIELCPNYLISEHELVLRQHTLYTAHELTQMAPLFGLETYQKMRSLNKWTENILPNAIGLPRKDIPIHILAPFSRWFKALAESILGSRWINPIESWEMERKIHKFNRIYPESNEADFCADWCKGHFGEYGLHTQNAYNKRFSAVIGQNSAAMPWNHPSPRQQGEYLNNE